MMKRNTTCRPFPTIGLGLIGCLLRNRAQDTHVFRGGTTFKDVIKLYIFDRKLRLLIMDAIERVEVAFRAQWAHYMAMEYMAMEYGPHGYLNKDLYAAQDRYTKLVDRLGEDFERSTDTFAVHYRDRYTTPELPPIWMVGEIISFGQLSKWIASLKHRADRKKIASPFKLNERVFTSFCFHLSYIRNICAHHGRLWNKRFTIPMKIPKSPGELASAVRVAKPGKLHNTLATINHLLSIIAPKTQWQKRIIKLIDSYPIASPTSMGFPDNWRNEIMWRP